MPRSLLSMLRGASLPEYGTLVSLVATLAVVSSIGFSHRNAEVFADGAEKLASLQDRLTLRCLTRTRASDHVSARQADPYNCFHLGQGNDEITLARGENIVYPGPNNDLVTVLSSAGQAEIRYSGGDDTYRFYNANGVVDFGNLKRSGARLGVRAGEDGSTDLYVNLGTSSVRIQGHFDDRAVRLLRFSDKALSQAEIAEVVISDQQSPRSDHIVGTPQSETINPGAGNDYVDAGRGDDVINYVSGHDRYDAGPGRDVVEIPVNASDLTFTVTPNAEDIIVTVSGKGKVILLGQALHSEFSSEAKFALLRHDGGEMTSVQIHERAIQDQSSDADSTIYGTSYADLIYPGKGNNKITPGAGNDIIYYQGGTDRILPFGDRAGDKDVLDLTQYAREDVTFQHAGQGDLQLNFPDGGSVTVVGQLTSNPDSASPTIDDFRFSAGTLSANEIRQMLSLQPI